MTISQAQIIINQFSNLSINKQVHMDAPGVNYVLIPFEGNINPGYKQGLKIYLQSTKDIDKVADKLEISVSNAKYIMYHFISLAHKYGMGSPCIHSRNWCRPKEHF